MFKKELKRYREGDKEIRHFILIKWMFVCFCLSFVVFFLAKNSHFGPVAFFLIFILIVGNGVLGVISFFNFFSQEPAPEKKYKKPKQPWE